jgi:hypothetical protein
MNNLKAHQPFGIFPHTLFTWSKKKPGIEGIPTQSVFVPIDVNGNRDTGRVHKAGDYYSPGMN